MDKQERFKIYDKAEELWGLVAQYDQLVEEMAELTVAVSKYKRKCLYGEYKGNSKVEENVVEELADVYMCMEQIIRYMGEDKVMAMLETKLGKLQEEIVYMEKIKEEKK